MQGTAAIGTAAIADMQDTAIAAEIVRPITRREWAKMAEIGLFEGERVELLHGFPVNMSPHGSAHARAIRRLTEMLVVALHGQATVQIQLPLALSELSVPEPDVSVVPRGDYADHPAHARLIIEVAESSLNIDRGAKANLYAKADVPEYWIVNLVDKVLEVRTRPEGGAYRETTAYGPGESVASRSYPDIRIEIDDILG